MRPLRHTISLAEAQRLTVAEAEPIERIEHVPLADANGRVLAQAIVAAADVPPFSRAAMDGFAVRSADTAGATPAAPRELRCIDSIFTGQAPARPVATGECAQIATGAPIPEGADAVVMVEDTDKADGSSADGNVLVMNAVSPRQNIGRQGSDISAGEQLLTPGIDLSPSRLGVCAAAGYAHIHVYARPVVAIVSTGGEIVEPGQPLGPAQIYDINRFTLSAIVEAHGGEPKVLRSAADLLHELTALLVEAAGRADIIVFSGGSSVGDRDLVLDALRENGEVLFHGIAVKPGKPTALGRVNGRPVLGMPGNPTSCLSNAYLLLVPMLRRMARLPEYRPRTVNLPLSARITSSAGRHQFYTVRIEGRAAVPAFKSSGDITSMSRADGYIELDAQTDLLEAGTPVEVKLF